MGEQMLLFDQEVVAGKLLDSQTPGFAPELDPFEADAAGAFVEHALDQADAVGSGPDVLTLELFP